MADLGSIATGTLKSVNNAVSNGTNTTQSKSSQPEKTIWQQAKEAVKQDAKNFSKVDNQVWDHKETGKVWDSAKNFGKDLVKDNIDTLKFIANPFEKLDDATAQKVINRTKEIIY